MANASYYKRIVSETAQRAAAEAFETINDRASDKAFTGMSDVRVNLNNFLCQAENAKQVDEWKKNLELMLDENGFKYRYVSGFEIEVSWG